MKKIFIIYFILFVSQSFECQSGEWKVFKSPFLPVVRIDKIEGNNSILISRRTRNNQSHMKIKLEELSNKIFHRNEKYIQTIPGNFVVCMVNDGKGNIWIGTYDGGLAKYDGFEWFIYDVSNSILPSNTIFTLHNDNNAILWIGTTEGLVKYDGENWKLYNTSNSKLPSNIIYSLAHDKSGTLWIGTTRGLVQMRNDNMKVFLTSSSKLPSNYISVILVDNENNKWIGTYEGLVKYDGKNWRVYTSRNSGLPYNDIYSLNMNKSGELIIGTWGGGFTIYDYKSWQTYKRNKVGIQDNNISSSVIDKNQNLWIGTLNGLAKYDGRKWLVFNTGNSKLPNNEIYSLLQDENENFWVGTKSGLAIFNEKGIKQIEKELPQFYSKIEKDFIQLFWQVDHYEDLSGFEIEKKDANSIWRRVGFVEGIKNNQSGNKYSFIDPYPTTGINYYRLKQIDFAGEVVYSNQIETSVNIPHTSFLRSILTSSLNPTIKISFGISDTTPTKIIITDIIGNHLRTVCNSELSPGNYEIEIDSLNLQRGVYFCFMDTKDFSSARIFTIPNY